MNYDVVLSPKELEILNANVGKNFFTLELSVSSLRVFKDYGHGIEISTDDSPTPEKDNPLASVVRTTVNEFQLSKSAQEFREEFGVGIHNKEITKEAGELLSIGILKSCILFTDIKDIEEVITIGEVKFPTTGSWNLVRYPPNLPKVQFIRNSPDVGKAIVIADLGLNFTFRNLAICIYTTGVVSFLDHSINTLPSELQDCIEVIPLK